MKANIIYWSGTGNTEKMAQLIADGAKEAGADVTLKTVSQATPQDATDCDVLIMGCPSMGAEVLEEEEFEPYMTDIEGSISGKKVALFGSYGWGDGEWMRDWDGRIAGAGATLAVESLIVNEMPEGEEADKCTEFGKSIVA